ncbi:UPF0481 protein [Salix suchowensis]|nr:UPF0481 protein [Salix suchowensis]
MENDEVTKKANMEMFWYLTGENWEIQYLGLYLEGLKESPPPKDRADECCIYRVPNSLRDSNPEAYTPQLISIGPFHHYSGRLGTLRERYEGEFIKRNEMDAKKILDFLRRIQKEEESVRRCYSDQSFNIYKESFVRMIVQDAVFIIEFLKESCAAHHFPKNIDTRMRFCIEEDLMLLENQLPFSILDLIYSEFYHHSQDENETPLLDLATRHFGKYPLAQGPESIRTTDTVQHFTDLLLKSMLKGALERENRRDPIKLKYNAAMLRKAGVKFQKTEDKCLFNVHFENGVLKIPILKVDDSLERVVRNVMAWEQCSKPDEAYISNYFKFMDHLIDRAEDVALLAEEGIIMNWLGNDAAVSELMNNLSQRSETASYYSDICQTMNDFYENPWNHRKATLKLVYFSNLWRGTGTLAAALLLIFTLIQTITSLKSAF